MALYVGRCGSLLCLLGIVRVCVTQTTDAGNTDADDKLLAELEQRFADFQALTKNTIKMLTRQVMLQQHHVEEKIRSDGSSGIKQSRVSGSGTRPYFVNSFTSVGVASGHDHANYDRTIGLGEFIAVMNGVEFRTRHNDYKLRMPATTNKNWNALEDIPFPPVPPSVLNKPTVQEQVMEMREYFRAFHWQTTQHRDWRPYFKPVMCYPETGWTVNAHSLEELFHSDRHHIDAKSWHDLQEKIRYTPYSGCKNNLENLSFLPTTIINITEEGIPEFAQWNYRLACHQIKTDFDLRYFRLVVDLAVRMQNRQNLTAYAASRVARFAITPEPGHYSKESCHAEYEGKATLWGKLDEKMSEIPGKDNYPGNLTGDNFGKAKYRVDMQNKSQINTAFYHRMYRTVPFGEGSQSVNEEGFSDRNLYVAETSSPRIAKMGVSDCHHDNGKEVCRRSEGRYTYAIPMEVVWLTPLSIWNPHNVTIYDWQNRGKVYTGRRTGDITPDKAFAGASPDNYYLTPSSFFSGREVNRNIADTTRKSVGVLDQHGQIQKLSASGVRFLLPDIEGVGRIRTRYPVMPVHQEGSVIWKNLQALQDLTMDMNRHANMFPECQKPDIHSKLANSTGSTHYVTTISMREPPTKHTHDVFVSAEDMAFLRDNTTLQMFTMEAEGHKHAIEVKQDLQYPNALHLVTCDGDRRCFDRHGARIWNFK